MAQARDPGGFGGCHPPLPGAGARESFPRRRNHEACPGHVGPELGLASAVRTSVATDGVMTYWAMAGPVARDSGCRKDGPSIGRSHRFLCVFFGLFLT